MTSSQDVDNLLPLEIARHWNVYLNPQTGPRERFKAAKAAAYLAIKAFEAGERDMGLLARYVDIVAAGMRVPSRPQGFALARNKMVAVMLKGRGLDNVSTRLAKKGKIDIVSGVIVVADRDAQLDEQTERWGSQLESGQAAICALGSDGTYPCELRLVEGTEPVLPAKDYRAIEESTEEVVISVPSGAICCADPAYFVATRAPQGGADAGSLRISVEPGHYKIAFFLKKNSGLVVVVAATTAPARNDGRALAELSG